MFHVSSSKEGLIIFEGLDGLLNGYETRGDLFVISKADVIGV